MSRYRFELATRVDDDELRKVMAATPTAGMISVTFEREPSYFDACGRTWEFSLSRHLSE